MSSANLTHQFNHLLTQGHTYHFYVENDLKHAWLAEQLNASIDAQNKTKALQVVFGTTHLQLKQLQTYLNSCYPHLSTAILPDWELLPYDLFSPSIDILSQRLKTMYAMLQRQIDVVLIPIHAGMQRLAPKQYLLSHTFLFKTGQTIARIDLQSQLQDAGFNAVKTVLGEGEYSIRGAIIDLFPLGAQAYRLEFMDNTIEAIKCFDVETQRSTQSIDCIELLPLREHPFDKASTQICLNHLQTYFKQLGQKMPTLLSKQLLQQQSFAGMQNYLPLFFEQSSDIFDYLPKDSQLWFTENMQTAMQSHTKLLHDRHHFLQHHSDYPALKPQTLYLNEQEFFTACKRYASACLNANHENQQTQNQKNNHAKHLQNLPNLQISEQNMDVLAQFLQQYSNYKVKILADGLGRCHTLMGFLKPLAAINLTFVLGDINSDAQYVCFDNFLHQGYINHISQTIWLTEHDLFAQKLHSNYKNTQTKNRQASEANIQIHDLSDVMEGDAIVHLEHGIGRYKGLIELNDEEFLQLEYANQSMLYTPIQDMYKIGRYQGISQDLAPIHALGNSAWQKHKQKAYQKVFDTATELLDVYAKRALKIGFKCDFDAQMYELFAQGFGFEETDDQQSAIEAVINDLCTDKPMDRLVCGDVGFGKTEVALRAAFVAVMSGKQVALLAPTTLLVEQHYQTFLKRFANWPVNIADLSRFTDKKSVQQAMQQLKDGSLNIVIGTHKLLSDTLEFKQLGLVIIDEEHRFGVRQKEAFKQLRSGTLQVDVLALTATPIPRSLGMALEGIRDFSIIQTAPNKRLSVKTFIYEERKSILEEAIRREIQRGGQVYLLHNDIQSIYQRQQQLKEQFPDIGIEVAHGQMPGSQLEQIMKDFTQQRFQVLVCTTIIETGIDVPNANTIIVHKAQQFGLAQLHQLRGRVGRSHHQAYAYLLVEDWQNQPKQAKKRLEAITEFQTLGSGFALAMQDLEIRGCGELLGDKQAGEVNHIGFNLYTQLLNKAIRQLKAGQAISLEQNIHCVIELGVSCILPKTYVADMVERLAMYKQFANAHTLAQLTQLKEGMIDQFGKPPLEATQLYLMHELRLKADSLGLLKIQFNPSSFSVEIAQNHTLDTIKLIGWLQSYKLAKLTGQAPALLTGQWPVYLQQGKNVTQLEARFALLEQRLKWLSEVLS